MSALNSIDQWEIYALKLRIGTKLAILAALGVVLVISLILNQQLSGSTFEQAMAKATPQQRIIQDASAAMAQASRISLGLGLLVIAVFIGITVLSVMNI